MKRDIYHNLHLGAVSFRSGIFQVTYGYFIMMTIDDFRQNVSVCRYLNFLVEGKTVFG